MRICVRSKDAQKQLARTALSLQTYLATVQSRPAPAFGPRWRHITVRLILSRRVVEVPLTPQISQSPTLFLGKSMPLRGSSVPFVLRRGPHSPDGLSLPAPGLFHHLHPLSRRTGIYYYYVTVAVPKEMVLSAK